MKLLCCLVFFISSYLSYSQITNPKSPQYKQFAPIQIDKNKSTYQYNTPTRDNQCSPKVGATSEDIIKQQNAQALQLLRHQPQKQRDRQKESLEIVKSLLAEEDEVKKNKQNFQLRASKQEEGLYLDAAHRICAMVYGVNKIDLKRAVWLAEYPYLRGQYSYDKYKNKINQAIEFCKRYAKETGLDWKLHDHRVKALVNYFSKTIVLKNGDIHKRIMYDFNDPLGRRSYQSLMVSKVLDTNTGQCHSMPLLFKILASEMDIKAYICLSPSHSYIKIYFDDGRTPVFETTNGNLSRDNWLLSSNIVPFTALRNGVYLDTLSDKETLVHCLNHLATSYQSEFGYKRFVIEVAQVAVQEAPKYAPSWALFSNYVTYQTMNQIKELNYPKIEDLDKYPNVKQQFELMHRIYADMDKMGYKALEETEYKNWLKNNQQAIKNYKLEDY